MCVLLNPSLQHVYNTDLSVSVVKNRKQFEQNMIKHVHVYKKLENACEQDREDGILNKQVP